MPSFFKVIVFVNCKDELSLKLMLGLSDSDRRTWILHFIDARMGVKI